jgi:predicted ribosome quality control (RQC) complex YloA/Tae2 family protein
LKQLNDQLSASLNYVSKNKQKFAELESDHHYQAWGDLIMANLHNIKTGDKSVTAENFYNNNEPIEIKLKEDLSPQKNAETYYRKGKNQQIEIQKLKETVAQKEKEIERITKTISALESTEVLRDVRKKADEAGLAPKDEKQAPTLPYHEFEFKGYKIWVGRNAEKNDELTLKYSYKEDLWLHAKDVPGSHVIIKHQAGKNFPKDVIERAAELAAYNSKRKTDSLCPVAFTPKKFVRKRKGDPAGAVVVEREEVIMVKPKLDSGY